MVLPRVGEGYCGRGYECADVAPYLRNVVRDRTGDDGEASEYRCKN